MSPGPWSYSAISTYNTCPRKYEGERVTKEVKFRDNEHTLYGKALHTAAEEYIRDGKPLPPQFGFIEPYLKKLQSFPGEKHCELKVGLKKHDGRFTFCDFFDPEVWFRGVADLVILDGARAWVFDYKTSKSARYADLKQLALMSAAIFAKHPEVETIKAGLLFVSSGEFVRGVYTRDKAFDIFADLHTLLTQRAASYETGVFNPKPNGLCSRWCGVLSCEHNGMR